MLHPMIAITPACCAAPGTASALCLHMRPLILGWGAGTGLLKHTRLNNVDWRMAAGLSVGSLLGSYCSSNLALSAPPHTMEAAFSLGMVVLGNRTLAAVRRGA